jgi:hypothetical protein
VTVSAPPTASGPDGGAAGSRWLSLAAAVLAAFLAVLFVLTAATRRLNFDESLALHAGWLHWHHVDAAPAFYMPWTLALGWLGTAVGDPGWAIRTARVVAALAVLAALAFAFRRLGLRGWRLGLTFALTLAVGPFAVHAYELRYDTAMLLGMLIACGCLARCRDVDFFVLGLTVAWLASHHLKGVFFAAAVLAAAVLAIVRVASHPNADVDSRRATRPAAGLAGGLAAGAAIWLVVVLVLGGWHPFVATYRTFLGLAVATERVGPWQSFHRYLERNPLWWLAALACAVATLAALLRRRGRGWGESGAAPVPGAGWPLTLALPALAFPFLHPHPWPYMLALPVPFLAAVLTQTVSRRSWAAGLALAWVLVSVSLPWSPYLRALRAPAAPEIASLRWLAGRLRPGDRVVDPSGIAYFVPPCGRQWYLDTLFAQLEAQGRWMQGADGPAAEGCAWMADTYRLGLLRPALRHRLAGRYVPIGGGLFLRSDDPRLAEIGRLPILPQAEIASFWW